MAFIIVKAKAKGYHIGPREPGDTFKIEYKDGSPKPKGSWFDEVEAAKPAPQSRKGAPVLNDEELA